MSLADEFADVVGREPVPPGRFEAAALAICADTPGAVRDLFEALEDVGLVVDQSEAQKIDLRQRHLRPGWRFPFGWVTEAQSAAAQSLLVLGCIKRRPSAEVGKKLFVWLGWTSAGTCMFRNEPWVRRRFVAESPEELVKMTRWLDRAIACTQGVAR